jgi:hypothetical protein
LVDRLTYQGLLAPQRRHAAKWSDRDEPITTRMELAHYQKHPQSWVSFRRLSIPITTSSSTIPSGCTTRPPSTHGSVTTVRLKNMPPRSSTITCDLTERLVRQCELQKLASAWQRYILAKVTSMAQYNLPRQLTNSTPSPCLISSVGDRTLADFYATVLGIIHLLTSSVNT